MEVPRTQPASSLPALEPTYLSRYPLTLVSRQVGRLAMCAGERTARDILCPGILKTTWNFPRLDKVITRVARYSVPVLSGSVI